MTIAEGALHAHALSDQGAALVGSAAAGELLQLRSGALQPADPNVCATAGGNGIQLWDLRSMGRTGEQAVRGAQGAAACCCVHRAAQFVHNAARIAQTCRRLHARASMRAHAPVCTCPPPALQGAHRMPVRDVSFTAASENRLVSGGDDCKLRVWDLRWAACTRVLHMLCVAGMQRGQLQAARARARPQTRLLAAG